MEDLIMAPGVVSWSEWRRPADDLHLDLGEYYIPDDILDRIEATGHDNPDGEMEEEAEEGDEAVYDRPVASLGFKAAADNDTWSAPPNGNILKYYGDNMEDRGGIVPAASLGALPETLSQKNFHYSVDCWYMWEALSLERVCKAMHRALRAEGIFWDLHHHNRHRCSLPFTGKNAGICQRSASFQGIGLRLIRRYQKFSTSNLTLSVLEEEHKDGSAADNFRLVAAGVMAKMMKSGTHCTGTPRLRGDTVGYLAELLQGFAIHRLQSALRIAVGAGRDFVTKDDIILLFIMRSHVVPGQIKEAAGKRFAWEAFNGTVYGLSWPASTDFTTEEETKEEMMYYGKAAEGLKLEDNVCRQESSAIDFDEAEEMDCEYKYESEGYDTEVDDEEYDVMSIGEEFQSAWGGSADECVKRAVSPLSGANLSYFDDAQLSEGRAYLGPMAVTTYYFQFNTRRQQVLIRTYFTSRTK